MNASKMKIPLSKSAQKVIQEKHATVHVSLTKFEENLVH